MNRNNLLMFLPIFMCVVFGLCRADTVFLRDGSEIEGSVVEENSAQVVVKLPSGGTRTLRRAEVDSILKSRNTNAPAPSPAQPPPQPAQKVAQPASATAKPESTPSAPNPVVDNLRKLAERGDAASQLELGKHLCCGEGVAQNEEEGEKWLQRASEHSAEYKYLVGFAFYVGDGVRQNTRKGQPLIDAAAEGGHANAERFVAVEFLNATPPNIAKATEWLKKGAEHGDAYGQFLLAQEYANGTGVEKNATEAEKWMRKSAALGFPQAVDALKKMAPEGSH